ncbi:hypothetical protein Cni_G10222 [Canna indica]|uniref:WRKY19-like zinc finger domain-containing protein n=1 Tax=Canna indica TaxID=4628 RepID=A0AAQ3K5R6_9LILI|nr:hypothetical protein Cni_G10222 [Canna indica]
MDDCLLNLGSIANPSSLSTNSFSSLVQSREGSTDIMLQLDSPGSNTPYCSKIIGTKRMLGYVNGIKGSQQPSLDLGLGQSLDSPDVCKMNSKMFITSSPKEVDEVSVDLGLNFQLCPQDLKTWDPKSFASISNDSHTGNTLDLQLSLSVGSPESVITGIKPIPDYQDSLETSVMVSSMPSNDDEGTASSCWIFSSYLEPHFQNSKTSSGFASDDRLCEKVDPVAAVADHPSTMLQTLKSPVICTSENINLHHQNSSIRNCQFQGCAKRARGASGLCIAHGGGRRCQKPGCQKGAEGRTIFCKAHGGGRRCEHLGCTKSAEGRTDYCIAHGGGRRCSHEGCNRAARGKSGLCIRHGGGKRCTKENCTKSAEGYSGLCISHGGGKRCQFPSCSKGAQGSTMFCKAHGGGKRCTFMGCTKGAEGSTPFCKGHGGGKRCSFQGGGVCPKSVHGGTLFCVAHGGGKRCVVPECTKSARGRTSYCVRHGGGKRCKYEGCGKSAQGSTDFCKAHGGGKRCSWGQLESKLGTGNPPCDRFARTKAGLCAAHDALVQDQCVHGGGTITVFSIHYPTPIKSEKMKEAAARGNEILGWSGSHTMSHPVVTQCGFVSLPEGRVHGGSLMAMLATSSSLGNHA